MMDKKIFNINYYFNSMSKFLLNSYGTEERFNMYLSILTNIRDVSEDIFSRLDIYNIGDWTEKSYFKRNSINKTTTDDKWLDIIASIYNISRNMQITYFNPDTSTTVTESITLNNWELFMYIKVMISKLNFGGTAKEIIDLYGFGNISSNDEEITYLGINYIWKNNTSPQSLSCNVIFNNPALISDFKNNGTNKNICKLFLADLLLIESLGITYAKALGTLLIYGKFYDPNDSDSAKFYDSNDSYIYIFS